MEENAMTHVKVSIKTPHGEIDGGIGVPHRMMTSVDLLPGALDLTDNLVGMAIERAKEQDLHVSCTKGCSRCCYQMVPVSKPEAFFLLDLMRERLPDHIRSMVKERLKDAAERLGESGIADQLKKPDLRDEDHGRLGEDYFRLDMPCPFLADHGACGIHPLRPSACREYNVVTPAELCEDPVGNKVQVPLPALKMSMVLAQLYAQETGTQAELMPLVLAPAWAAEHEDERGPPVLGPELFGRFMGIVARAGRPKPEDPGEPPPDGE
jgi:Fe-S-cluster containining protein